MDEFIEYGKFLNLEMASELRSFLEANNIPYQIDDRSQRFQLISTGNPMDDQISIQVRKSDIEKIDASYKGSSSNESNQVSIEHFIYTFSDDDLIEVMVNTKDWTIEEQELAKKLIAQKGIVLTADKIKKARGNSESNYAENVFEKNIKGSAGWFSLIGVLSIVNTIIIAMNISVNFIFGLGITRIIDSFIINNEGRIGILGLIINISISSIFLIIYKYAKQKYSWAYISGMILYGLDSLIFVVSRDWLDFGFHVFALIIIASGFSAIRKKLIKNDT